MGPGGGGERRGEGPVCDLAAAKRVEYSGGAVRRSVGWGRSSHSTSMSSGRG